MGGSIVCPTLNFASACLKIKVLDFAGIMPVASISLCRLGSGLPKLRTAWVCIVYCSIIHPEIKVWFIIMWAI